MRYFVTLLIFVFCLPYLQASKYPIQNFTPADYKAGIQNIDFSQNRNMTLFVANNLGVLSYNGNSWNLQYSREGKKDRSLAFDEKTNRLYVGSQGAFGYFTDDWKYISLSDKVPPESRDFDEVWDVFLFNSKVYFCTFQGIYVYDGETVFPVNQGKELNRAFQTGGRLFVQSQSGKLYEIQDTSQIEIASSGSPNRVIVGIVPHKRGLLLFYNSGKIDFLSPSGAVSEFLSPVNTLQGKYVNHVLQLSDSRLAISTQTAGLFIYDLQEEGIENITVTEGLMSNACLRSFQDYSGNLWVGMQNGISLIDLSSPMRFTNQEINLEGSGYETFDAEEGSYYTTSNGIYFLGKQNTKSVFLRGTEGPAYGLQLIDGKLYAGHHTGLFLLSEGKALRLASTHGLWQVKQLQSYPEYAVGGTYSGLFLFKTDGAGTLRPIGKIKGFEESSRFFEEDRQGSIWVGQFYKGLYRLSLSEDLESAEAERIQDEGHLPINDRIILSRINEELYLGTKAGVYHINQNTLKIEPAELFQKDIGEQPVYLLAQDKKKNIHIITENLVGFFKQIGPSNHTFITSSLFQFRYFFNNDLLNVSVNTNDGVLFNANEGFINYKPESEKRVRSDEFLIISKVFSVTEDSVLYARKPFEEKPERLSPLQASVKAKVLQFSVESFQYSEMKNQQFRYFLKGFDKDYGEWTDVPLKEYTNLKEGNYEFHVQTRNYFGETVSGEPFLFSIDPPFYKSALAKFLYVLAGISFMFLLSGLQRRRYKKKTRKVAETKELELARKQQELQAVERQKEEELRRLEEEQIKTEMRHLNNLLAASTMNLVVKNEFMETVKEKLKEVKQKEKNKEAKQSLEQIVKDIDTTLRLQEDWKQFEYHFDKVHGDFLGRLRNEYTDLSPNEQKLCAFLRLNLNTKDIANIMGISLRGVEVARYRLRKKLNLDKGVNLSKFILDY